MYGASDVYFVVYLSDNSKTIAYYNLSSGDRIRLKLKKRGGIRINKCNRVKETKKSHAEEGDDDDQVEEKKETIQNDVQQQQANGVMAPSPPPPPSE